jgi:hypothetical protein
LKLGTENKKETIIAAVLVAFAAWFGIRQFTSGPTAGAAPPAPSSTSAQEPEPGVAQRSNVTPRSQQQRKNAAIALPSGVPGLRLDLLKLSQQIAYAGTGRNIFRDEPEPLPKPVHPVINPQPVKPPVQQGPPPPPPINLKFFGFANRPGQAKQVFLAEGDDTFIAREGDIVDRRYKVLKINNSSVEIQDVLNNNTQTIPLSQ